MTAFDRFDPFERRISDAIDEIAVARVPDYLDDILRLTARSSQRPRWTFLERWLPVDTSVSRPTVAGRLPVRQLVVLALLVTLVAAALVLSVGQQRRLPPPFGPASNGALLYASNEDIYVRDSLTGSSRLLIGGIGSQFAPSFSPNGLFVTYVTNSGAGDEFMFANADGSNPVLLAKIPATGNAQAAWAPDSQRVGLIYDVKGQPQLSIVTATGATTVIQLEGLSPLDLEFSPPDGKRLLVRASVAGSEDVGLYTMDLDGSDRQTVVAPISSDFGTTFTLSGAQWSPDGSTIAYNGIAGARGGHQYFRVHLVNADGTGDRAVPGPGDPGVQENWPLYSPDGKWIAVNRWTFGSDGTPGTTGWLAIMPAHGTEAAHDVGLRFEDKEDTGIEKLWSPDATRLLEFVGPKQQVYAIDPATSQSELLPWATTLPDWQRVAK